MLRPYEITTPHFKPLTPRRVRLINNTFVAGGVAPVGHTVRHLFVHLAKGSTILRGWDTSAVGPSSSGVSWATVCDLEGLDLTDDLDYNLVLSHRPRPYGNFCVGDTLGGFGFSGYIGPKAAAVARATPEKADLRFPANDTEHSRFSFSPTGMVATGETVPYSNCILKDATGQTIDTADAGNVTSRNVWSATFFEVVLTNTTPPYRFEFTSSTGSMGAATGLTFV